jgi:DNA-binding NarL/FixJ family response regulator
LKGIPVELGYNDPKGYPVTSLIMNMELSALEQSVLTMTKEGKSQRIIADKTGKSKTTIGKTQARLRAKNLLTRDET